MLVIPAIDLKDGQAVRLFKGDYNQKTVYSNEPEKLAENFEKMGAKLLHVVDLDGAKDGECINLETIKIFTFIGEHCDRQSYAYRFHASSQFTCVTRIN